MTMKTPKAQVPCGLCGAATPVIHTRRCNRCWELETRIKADPVLAVTILFDLGWALTREAS